MVVGLILAMLLAVVSGILSGLLGIGGNVVIIPLLFEIFSRVYNFPADISMKFAIGTAVVIMLFSAASSAYGHYKKGNVHLQFYRRIMLPLIIGTIIGALCVGFINGVILEKIFGIFLLAVSANLVLQQRRALQKSNKPIKILSMSTSVIVGFIIGFKSGLLGIGGGTLLIPLLMYLNYPPTKISGTTSICSLTVAATGALVFISHGFSQVSVPHSIGYIYLPIAIAMSPITILSARYGVKLSTIIPQVYFSRMLLAILVVLGLHMLF